MAVMPFLHLPPSSRFFVRDVRSQAGVVFTLKDERVPGEEFYGTHLIITSKNGRRVIRPKADNQAGAHYGSRFFGLRAVPGTHSYLIGIEFGLNDVNEYHVLLIEPQGVKYLYKDTERGELWLVKKRDRLFVHHQSYPEDWAEKRHAWSKRTPDSLDRYLKYDPVKKVLVPSLY